MPAISVEHRPICEFCDEPVVCSDPKCAADTHSHAECAADVRKLFASPGDEIDQLDDGEEDRRRTAEALADARDGAIDGDPF